MAIVAVIPIQSRMIIDENGIGCRVAFLASYQCWLVFAMGMARFATNQAVIKVGLVLDEAVVSQPLMLERLKIIGGNIGFPPLMLGMTLAAVIRIRQAAVHAGPGQALLADSGVAAFAAAGCVALPGRVTFGAGGLEFGVGGEAGQRLLARVGGRQLPRAKRPAAKVAQNDSQNQYHHDSRGTA